MQLESLNICNQELEQEIRQLKSEINNLKRQNRQLTDDYYQYCVSDEIKESVRVAFAERTKRASNSTEGFTAREKLMFRSIAVLTGIGIGLVMLSSL